MKQTLELYIHIPFCVQKCRYCDFLSAPQDENTKERYVEALIREIDGHRQKRECYEVSTIFWGGGTPSVLSPDQTKRIFAALHEAFSIRPDAEITIEVNPGTVTEEKFDAYRQCGVNRISFGLQSANNEELCLLGRIHTYEEFEQNFHMAKKYGFDQINVDLISAIPKQDVKSFERTLETVIRLQPEHISAYSLIVEEGTPFYELYGEGMPCEKDLPDEEEERRIYERTGEVLRQAGYHRYELSNYAKDGKVCRHNLGYWERVNYLGLGLGASSLVDGVRFHNTTDLEHYIDCSACPNDICEDVQELSVQEEMEEFMFLGLRKTDGISADEFYNCFQKDLDLVYGTVIEKLIAQGLLTWKGRNLALTDQGIDISNYVLAEFLQ